MRPVIDSFIPLFGFTVLACTSDNARPSSTTTSSDPTESTPQDSKTQDPDSGDTASSSPEPEPEPDLVLAVIGDYGMNNADEAAVASLIDSWEPDFVLTTGDNNYQSGEAETIDANIGQYFQQYIHPYTGTYGEGAEVNAFYPCPGNHDWFGEDGLKPYTDYFELPGNERYYQVSLDKSGLVDVFCVDSDTHEPDGVTTDSIQAAWLEDALKESSATWRIVTLHHAPYTSGVHQDADDLQWAYGEWGAHMVFAGHDHNYERIVENGTLYTVNGAGGASLRSVQLPTTGTQVWNVTHHGAQRIQIWGEWLTAEFVGIEGEIIDQFHVHADHSLDARTYLVKSGANWRYLDNGKPPEEGWTTDDYDDSAWPEGGTSMGYGDYGHTTTLDYGDDVDKRHISTWLRHSFQVDDPDAWSQLTLFLRRDDGAVVYLNGTEVLKSNLPDEVSSDTLASDDVAGTDENTFYSTPLDLSLLQPGENVLAVELHQSSPESEDLAFDLRLEAEGGDEIISSGADWQWSIEQTEDWTAADFDSSSWNPGVSPLGFGLENEQTETTAGTITTWFRHEFEVQDPSEIDMLLLQLARDDGTRVLLNGHEVLRSNLPPGELTADTLAHAPVEDLWQTTWQNSHVDPALLVSGTNVIGIEVHQASAKDSDLRMDMKLIRL